MIKRALVLILAVMILALPALATEYTVSLTRSSNTRPLMLCARALKMN